MMLTLTLFSSRNPNPRPNQLHLLPYFLSRPRNPTSLRSPKRRSNSSLHHVSLPDPTKEEDEGEGLSPSSVAALAAAIRRASPASTVQFTQSVQKPGKAGLVLPSPDFHRICIEQLDLFRTVVHRDAVLSVFVRPAGSYMMDQLELHRVTFYPGIDVSENADCVMLVGNFSAAAGLHAAEAFLSKQQVEFISEYGAVVLPMVKHPFVMGFLIAELPKMEIEVCENAPLKEQHLPFYSKKDESPRLPPHPDKRMWEIPAVDEEPCRNYAQFTIEQTSIAIMISRSLAIAYVMDQAPKERMSRCLCHHFGLHLFRSMALGRPCIVSEVLKDLVGAAVPLATKQQRFLQLSEVSHPLHVAVEESALRQALSNLIEGALLRTQIGGRVEVYATSAPAGGALIVIDDNGPDMHYMTQIHSLTPFGENLLDGKVEDNLTWNFVAGVAVAREVLENYGCVVRVISPRNPDAMLSARGTRIELWLPSSQQDDKSV